MASLGTLFCGFTIAGGLCFGQTPEAAKLMRLNVLALDSRGQALTDLTADDLRVTDEGKAEHISLFRALGAAPAAQAGVREQTNRPAPVPHTTAVLFDFLNENRTDRLDAARKIGQSLKQLPSSESVYFYLLLLDGKLAPIHAFPADAGGAPDKNWAQDIEAMLAKAVKANSGNRPAGMADEEVTKKTYVALETLANQLAAFPGGRDIIWVTNGVPYTWPVKTCVGDWIECALYVPHLSVTLDRAGTVVNPVCYASLKDPATTRTMEEMAGLTGGRTYYSEDVLTVIKQLNEEYLGTYRIAYAPPPESWDNRFHKLKVTCERKGVKLQTKQRYYALPDSRPGPERERAALVAAYQSPADMADIGLRAALSPSGNRVRVEMRVDPADLVLSEKGGEFADQLTILFSARADTGPQGDPTISSLDVHLTREQREAAKKDGIAITREYPIDGATKKIRMIVLDKATNSVGSVTAPIAANP